MIATAERAERALDALHAVELASRMELWDGDLPEEERVLLDVKERLSERQEKGDALAEAVSTSEVGAENLRDLIRLL